MMVAKRSMASFLEPPVTPLLLNFPPDEEESPYADEPKRPSPNMSLPEEAYCAYL